jgi:hypothetical protein
MLCHLTSSTINSYQLSPCVDAEVMLCPPDISEFYVFPRHNTKTSAGCNIGFQAIESPPPEPGRQTLGKRLHAV